jgi:hypothetical protein
VGTRSDFLEDSRPAADISGNAVLEGGPMKLTVPAIRAAVPAANRDGAGDQTRELLDAIDALLAESMAEAPVRELEKRRRASMALHPSAGLVKSRGAGRPLPPEAA